MADDKNREPLIRIPHRLIDSWLDFRSGGTLANGERGGLSRCGTYGISGASPLYFRAILAVASLADANQISILGDGCGSASASSLARLMGTNAARLKSELEQSGTFLIDAERDSGVVFPAIVKRGGRWAMSPDFAASVSGPSARGFCQAPKSILGMKGRELDVALRFCLLFRLRFTNLARGGGIDPEDVRSCIGVRVKGFEIESMGKAGILLIDDSGKLKIPRAVFNAYASGLWTGKKRKRKK